MKEATKYKSIPSFCAILLGLGVGSVGHSDIGRPILIVGGATLATTIITIGVVEWLLNNIIRYRLGYEIGENKKMLAENSLGVLLTAYLFIAPEILSSAIAGIAIIGALCWAYIKKSSPSGWFGSLAISAIVVFGFAILFVALLEIFSNLRDWLVLVLVLITITVLVGAYLEHEIEPDIPRL